jgi:hypothetical protein
VQFGGEATDVPVIGDWRGDGAIKLGICRAATGTWYLDMIQNGVWDGCATDTCVRWGGDPMDKVVLGDCEGSGTTKIGVYRASTGTWYLEANGNGVWDASVIDKCIAWGGNPADQPIVGKW